MSNWDRGARKSSNFEDRFRGHVSYSSIDMCASRKPISFLLNCRRVWDIRDRGDERQGVGKKGQDGPSPFLPTIFAVYVVAYNVE